MRDPARIERILDHIRTIWTEYPDQRLGQVLHNYGGFPASDPYAVEDDDTESTLASSAAALASDGD